MMVTAYFICEEVGIYSQIDQKREASVMMRNRIVATVYEVYQVSLLKSSSKAKGVKIYRGAMKKRALDEMDYIKSVSLDFPPDTTDLVVEAALKNMAEKYSANTVIIDNHTTRIERKRIYETETESP